MVKELTGPEAPVPPPVPPQPSPPSISTTRRSISPGITRHHPASPGITRPALIHEHRIVTYETLAREMKATEVSRALPAKVAHWVLQQVALAWKRYFAACAAWEADPSRFLGHPQRPKQRRNLLIYTEQAISRAPRNRGYVVPSGLDRRVETRQTGIDQVRIVPHHAAPSCATHSAVEGISDRSVTPADVHPARVVAIDIGLNNLAAVTTNQTSPALWRFWLLADR